MKPSKGFILRMKLGEPLLTQDFMAHPEEMNERILENIKRSDGKIALARAQRRGSKEMEIR